MFDSRHVGVSLLRSFLFHFFHAMAIFLSNKHFCVFEMVSSLAFNVSILIRSLPVAVLFFICFHLPWCYLCYIFRVSVDYGTLFTMAQLGVQFIYSFYDLILSMDLSTLHV